LEAETVFALALIAKLSLKAADKCQKVQKIGKNNKKRTKM